MRAYGYSRRDKLSCRYGCCDFKGSLFKKTRHAVDKTRRKAARRFVCAEAE